MHLESSSDDSRCVGWRCRRGIVKLKSTSNENNCRDETQQLKVRDDVIGIADEYRAKHEGKANAELIGVESWWEGETIMLNLVSLN